MGAREGVFAVLGRASGGERDFGFGGAMIGTLLWRDMVLRVGERHFGRRRKLGTRWKVRSPESAYVASGLGGGDGRARLRFL